MENWNPERVVPSYLCEALVGCHSIHLNEAALLDEALSVLVGFMVVQIKRLLQDERDGKSHTSCFSPNIVMSQNILRLN